MKIFITDNKEIFEKNACSQKLLILNSTVHHQAGFDCAQIDQFNLSLVAIETEAAELMIAELKQLASKAPLLACNPYLATRGNAYDIAYSLLYPNFKQFVLKQFLFELFIKSLRSFFELPEHCHFELNFSGEFALLNRSVLLQDLQCQILIREQERAIQRLSWIKNLLFSLYSFATLFKKRDRLDHKKTHALLFLYDIPNEIDLCREFCKKVCDSNKLELNIIQLSTGIDPKRAIDAKVLRSGMAIHIHYFKDFKSRVRHNHEPFYDWAQKMEPGFAVFRQSGILENLDVYYAYAAHAIKILKPDITVYANTGEVGRVVSDISRYNQIPSINIEYSLFTDDALWMECNIKFSARACLGQASAELWKKRNDPTPLHVLTGFLRLDEAKKNLIDKKAFFNQHGLDPLKPTLFFASTWSAQNDVYNQEKARIIEELGKLCIQNNWNLIVKKHPAEADQFANEAVGKLKYNQARIFEHLELTLYNAISFSDIMLTQFSGASVEALYFKKPIVFTSLSSNNWANLSLMRNEPYVFAINDLNQLRPTIQSLLNDREKLDTSMEEGIGKFLYKADGHAGERIIELILDLASKNIWAPRI